MAKEEQIKNAMSKDLVIGLSFKLKVKRSVVSKTFLF